MNVQSLRTCITFVIASSMLFIQFGFYYHNEDLKMKFIPGMKKRYNYDKDLEEREESFNMKFKPSNCTAYKSIACSGALQLRIPEAYTSSLNFSYLIEKQTRKRNKKEKNTSKMKTILHWNPDKLFLQEAKYLTDNSGRKCKLISEKMITNKDDVDAIILIARKIFRSKKKSILPSKDDFTNAKFIFTSEEAPIRFSGNYSVLNEVIDYTYTHRKDSDICKSFIVHQKETLPPYSKDMRLNYAEVKTKMAAWFVSNCKSAPSLRMMLVKALKFHGVTVDIYGRCGEYQCDKTKGNYCYKMVEKIYKFYLSFENSLCNHYVTEKFTNILNYNIVPVTYGFGHELTGVPKHGYVDVLDFKNIKCLANYLIYLNENDTAYNEYFRWKNYYDLPDEDGHHNLHSLKKVCEALHDDLQSTPHSDLKQWFEEGQCVRPNENFKLMSFLRGYS